MITLGGSYLAIQKSDLRLSSPTSINRSRPQFQPASVHQEASPDVLLQTEVLVGQRKLVHRVRRKFSVLSESSRRKKVRFRSGGADETSATGDGVKEPP